MPNENIRAVLRGHEERIFDLMCNAKTSNQMISSWLVAPLEQAAGEGDLDLVAKLLGAGVEPNGIVLHKAVKGGHESVVSTVLLRNPLLALYRNTNNELPIHVAVRSGRVDILGLLLMNGAQEHIDSLWNGSFGDDVVGYQSALHLAVNCGNLAAVKALLEAGADIDLVGKGPDMVETTPLQLAARRGRIDVLDVLIAQGASLDDALHHAVEFDHVEILEKLLHAGADIDGKRFMERWTPLHTACYDRSVKCVSALLRRGARTDARNREGATPLHIASLPKPSYLVTCEGTSDEEIVEMLLRWGADETATDDTGKTPKERLTSYLLEEDGEIGNEEEIMRVMKLLACAPADRSWRRRSLFILCRAYPNRVQQVAMCTEPGDSRCRCLKQQRVGAFDGRCHEAGDTEGKMSDFWRVASWVLKLKQEELFRKILAFL